MKQVSEMPTSGQFVMIWMSYEGLCADTMIHNEDGFLCSLILGEQVDRKMIIHDAKERSVQYFIAD